MNDVREVDEIGTRLRDAAVLPDLLAASFDAFEIIRLLARRWDHQAPEFFAAFMTTADAAVDGREAVTAAPALPAGGGAVRVSVPAAVAGTQEVTVAVAALGALLNERLTHAAALAAAPADQGACARAADAGRRIHDMMTRADDRDIR